MRHIVFECKLPWQCVDCVALERKLVLCCNRSIKQLAFSKKSSRLSNCVDCVASERKLVLCCNRSIKQLAFSKKSSRLSNLKQKKCRLACFDYLLYNQSGACSVFFAHLTLFCYRPPAFLFTPSQAPRASGVAVLQAGLLGPGLPALQPCGARWSEARESAGHCRWHPQNCGLWICQVGSVVWLGCIKLLVRGRKNMRTFYKQVQWNPEILGPIRRRTKQERRQLGRWPHTC